MVHTRAMATGVAIMGITNRPRRMPLRGRRELKTSAASVPKTSGRTTARKV
jgi:hypothetical protein